MQILYNLSTGNIHLARNDSEPLPDLGDEYTVATVAGDAGQNDDGSWKYPWPHERGPSSCRWDGTAIVAVLPPVVPLTKEQVNAPILAQMAKLDLECIRPARELRRQQEHADVPANDVAFAKNKIKTIDDQIKALRATLQP